MSNLSTSIGSLALAAASLLFGTQVQAQLTVNRSVIEFTDGGQIQDVEVLNSGDFTLYVDIKPAEILSPETEQPERVELDDPRTAAIIASPRQLLIPPGERKRVRVILRDPATDIDRVFRLSVTPYTGKVKLAETEDGGKKASAIKVLIGYDLLLLSRPKKLNPDLDVVRTDDSIEFTNNGNTNVLLRTINQCDKATNECVNLLSNRLYAGESYRIDLPKKGPADQFPVEVMQSVGLDNSRETY